ncbi:RNA recognition motif domain-containing protein [Armatimonas rosea]|uniref:RNA recognition motif-containing protein n=1 Tax=Armatimonas rosea TaxID=685828 RepID=A0A7W9SMA3_ARMRO|nr:RNA-binding protein [Armatimonas rosea]MBB6048789.1 RNA recognition motif-containing protein [Armatimonas rosea]
MRIFVGGMPYTTNSEGLRALFAAKGEVTDANVVIDRMSGDSKGFGFVEMPNQAEAQAAINSLNGYSMGGRSLSVNEARPREESGGGRSGGGNRGGGNRW